MAECGMKTEVFSRVVGYYRPVQNWNEGKKEEFGERKTFSQKKAEEKADELGIGCRSGCK